MAGIYIHIPFCKQRCTYCDFHFSTTFESYREEMITAMCLELSSRAAELHLETIDSVYFGGGTPSLLKENELEQLFYAIRKHYSLNENIEITLEANPDDIKVNSLRSWKKLGFNRLSIGIQSFREKDLKWMNRAHTAEEAKNCVQLAQKEGFDALSVDLIYGLPELDMETWKNHINTVASFGVDHISAYCLTIEEKTILYKRVKDGDLIPSTEDEQSLQFEFLRSELQKLGYLPYEISNFCKPGKEAKHNSSYWKGVNYLGIGPSAHSYNGISRRYNIANNPRYLKLIREEKKYFEEEVLSDKDRFNELLMTGLRTYWGVNLDQLNNILPLTVSFKERVTSFIDKNLMEQKNGSIFLTNEGCLIADYLASELFDI